MPTANGPPAVLPAVKEKTYNRPREFVDFAYRLAELPVRVSVKDVHYELCSSFCTSQNIAFQSEYYPPSGLTHHPVDGKVIRDVATRRGLAAAIKLCIYDNPSIGKMTIVDAWGNNRTKAYINTAIGLSPNPAYAQGLFDFRCVAGVYDSKDLLRSNGRSNFVQPDVIESVTGAHVVLVQDVQQNSTSKEQIFELATRAQVVVVVAHIELGPMGFNGYHGFYLREGDVVSNWASPDDHTRYVDTQDFTWVLDESAADYKGVRINWCVQPIYGNAVFIIFTKTYNLVPSVSSEWVKEFEEVELEVANEVILPWWAKTMPDWCVNPWFVAPEKAEPHKGVVYHRIARKGAEFLQGNTYGVGTDKRLDKYVSDLFMAEVRFEALRKYNYAVYQNLVVTTTAMARRLDVKRLLEVARLGVNQAPSIRQAAIWRGLVDTDHNFDQYCCCLAPCLMSPMVCFAAVGVSALAMGSFIGGLWGNSSNQRVRVTLVSLPDSIVPDALLYAIDNKCDLETIDSLPYVRKFGVFTRPKRRHTQTPAPDQFRLMGKGEVYCEDEVGKRTPFPPKLEFSSDPPNSNTCHMGPNLIGWHSNCECLEGGIGMVNALLTPVTLPSGVVLSAEESCVRGQRLFDEGNRLRVPYYDYITVEQSEQLQAVYDHAKRNVYEKPLLKLLAEGREPVNKVLHMKSKTDELLLKDKERIIIACDPSVTAYYLAHAKKLTERFKETYSLANFHKPCMEVGKAVGHYVWGSGTTPEQRGEWFDLSLAIPPNHFSLTTCGDDLAGLINLRGILYEVETDAKNWDHTQTLGKVNDEYVGALNVQRYYYRNYGFPIEIVDSVLMGWDTIVYKQNYGSRQKFVVRLGYTRRASGLFDTTDGNTCQTADLMSNIFATIINEIDDSVEDVRGYIASRVVELGEYYGVYLKVKMPGDPRRMTFLKGFFVECTVAKERRTVWYPSPEILTKLGASSDNPSNNAELHKLQREYKDIANLPQWLRVYDIINSWKTFTGLPVLTGYQMMVRSPLKLGDKNASYEASVERARYVEKWDRPELTIKPVDHDWEPMLLELGIKDVYQDFHNFCGKIDWQPGMFISHPLIKILAERYM